MRPRIERSELTLRGLEERLLLLFLLEEELPDLWEDILIDRDRLF